MIKPTRSVAPRDGGPTFSRGHRLRRLFWAFVWAAFGRWTPVPFHGWRRFLLVLFGARIDRTAKVYPSAEVWYPPNLQMARYACLGPNARCYCMDRIDIGEYAVISQGAYLCGGTHDIDDADFPLITKPIIIGANAWIAAEAFVGPGVTVGDHAVLGARAVAFKDLEPAMVYTGNPAKPLRSRKISGDMA